MKLLITGATGFIGNHLTKALIKQNYDISLFTRKLQPQKNFRSFIGDLNNKKALLEATSTIDIVVHLAATYKGNLFKVNSQGTKNLIEACIKNKVKKIIFTSSYDVITNSNYGKSKLEAENIIKNSQIDYLIFRPTLVYGSGNNRNLNRLIRLIKKSPLIPIPQKGNIKFQPLFIDDLINILIQAITSKKKNKVYFVAGPNSYSFNEIVDLISKTFSKKPYKIPIPKMFLYLFNKNLLKDKTCNITEIKKDFNFNPLPLEEGLKNFKP